jgi:hypothetical protein
MVAQSATITDVFAGLHLHLTIVCSVGCAQCSASAAGPQAFLWAAVSCKR